MKKIIAFVFIICILLLSLAAFVVATDYTSTSKENFKVDGASAYGYLEGNYVNTYWAYFDNTKTLNLYSATKDYNETGRVGQCKGETSYKEYISQIEHVVIDDYLDKITWRAFKDFTALKSIQLGKRTLQIDGEALDGCKSLTTIYRGNGEKIEGRLDLSNMTNVGVIFSGGAYSEIVLPKSIKVDVLAVPQNLKTVYVQAITNDLVNFAKTNYVDLININNQSEKHSFYDENKRKSNQGEDYTSTPKENFKPEGAADYGYLEANYINTYWAYFYDTKTLKFYSATKDYNETGRVDQCKGETSYKDYISQIEHIVIDDYIDKISWRAFKGFSALKDIKLGKRTLQIDGEALNECSSLTTIYRGDGERIEGRVDFSKMTNVGDVFGSGAFNEIVLPSKAKLVGYSISYTVKTLYVQKTTDELIGFAKENYVDIININSPTEKHSFYDEAKKKELAAEASKVTSTYVSEYAPSNATAYGYLSKKYEKTQVVNTFWAYYDDTKTLEFVSGTSNYNETGSIGNCQDKKDWAAYKDKIEHIVIGDFINKVSTGAFRNYKSLKDIKLGKHVQQIDADAFYECPSLSAIYISGKEKVEGRADFSSLTSLYNVFNDCAIHEVVLPTDIKTLKAGLPTCIKTICLSEISEAYIEYAEKNLVNLQNLYKADEKYEFYIELDPNLPKCGERAVFEFDEATGTLTVLGSGKISDIVNFHGGGARNQPWVSINSKIKHVIITDKITSIGKYAFARCKNIETVELPNNPEFTILNAAFEDCNNLKSLYIRGTEPIEGTLDLTLLEKLENFTFAKCYLIANVILSDEIEAFGNSVFDENTNFSGVYGKSGTYAEIFANENGFAFYNSSNSVPTAVKCELPADTVETKVSETEKIPPETTQETLSETIETSTDTKDDSNEIIIVDGEEYDKYSSSSNVIIIIVSSCVVAVVLVIVVLWVKKSKSSKKEG